MKILLSRPSEDAVERFLSSQRMKYPTYKELGMTGIAGVEDLPPPGYVCTKQLVRLGEGSEVFQQAVVALREWRQFDLGWIDVSSYETPIEEGATVGILASVNKFWMLYACRIVYVVNEVGPIKRFGFAYGTLPGHPLCGEERFTVEWNARDNSVFYNVLAFSRPGNFVTQVAYPLVRSSQKRFATDSKRAMIAATAAPLWDEQQDQYRDERQDEQRDEHLDEYPEEGP